MHATDRSDANVFAGVAAVIGTACEDIDSGDSLEHIAGYVLAMRHPTSGVTAVGRVLVTRDEFESEPPSSVALVTNGRTEQSSSPSCFDLFADAISTASGAGGLRPGDVILAVSVGIYAIGDGLVTATHPSLGCTS
jgi:2-keto-4-pentenoate hydratase/2-oxohepta-3-ene-1,7-dioic acid hydratase in catechol pathway